MCVFHTSVIDGACNIFPNNYAIVAVNLQRGFYQSQITVDWLSGVCFLLWAQTVGTVGDMSIFEVIL